MFRRPCGLPDSVPNDATPAMLTAGPIGSVGGALQVAVGELRARFVDGPRRQRQRVAEGDRLIEVVEARTRPTARSARRRRASCSR